MARKMWYDGKVIRMETASPTTRRFWVEVQNAEVINFKAGQFVTMDLPIGEKRINRWRSYSIANRPDQTNIFEFVIVKVENGLATEYLFNSIALGDIIKFKEPDGGFCLPESNPTDMVMICTGTGVAPFRSMIEDLYHRGAEPESLQLIFGTRTADGILYQEEFSALAAEWNNFTYEVALSRQEHPDFNQGYVHDIYLNQHKEVIPERHFYICGWSDMIDEAVANIIIKMGYDKSQVHYELYG